MGKSELVLQNNVRAIALFNWVTVMSLVVLPGAAMGANLFVRRKYNIIHILN